MNRWNDPSPVSRRRALGLLGITSGAALFSSLGVSRATAVAPTYSNLRGTTAPPDGEIIRTILRDYTPDALGDGAVLMHEHLSIHYPLNVAEHFTDDVPLMTEEVRIAASEGVACIVDGGHADMARSLDALRRIATDSGMPIVASGGYYMQRSYPPGLATQSVDQIAEELAGEANAERLGAFGEIGQQGGEMTPDERKVFEAVGKAQALTGLPVFTHNAYTGRRAGNVPRDAGIRQLDLLETAGARPQSVAIGHVCCLDDPNVEIAIEIARRGAYVAFDRVTLNAIMPDENRVAMAAKFIEAGHADRLLLSSDFYSANSLKSRGGSGLAQTATVFAPMLRAAGVPEATVRQILVENPRRFLMFVPKA
jgi:phosphotriesterase-related protein